MEFIYSIVWSLSPARGVFEVRANNQAQALALAADHAPNGAHYFIDSRRMALDA